VIINDSDSPVLFFDGVCNLCNQAVQFIIRHDKKKIFLFAPLQSEPGQKAIAHFAGKAPDSVILLYKQQYLVRSDAALYTFRLLGGLWTILFAAIIIPRFLRDALYNFISRNRYKWFGKKNECMIPTPDLMNRFLSK